MPPASATMRSAAAMSQSCAVGLGEGRIDAALGQVGEPEGQRRQARAALDRREPWLAAGRRRVLGRSARADLRERPVGDDGERAPFLRAPPAAALPRRGLRWSGGAARRRSAGRPRPAPPRSPIRHCPRRSRACRRSDRRSRPGVPPAAPALSASPPTATRHRASAAPPSRFARCASIARSASVTGEESCFVKVLAPVSHKAQADLAGFLVRRVSAVPAPRSHVNPSSFDTPAPSWQPDHRWRPCRHEISRPGRARHAIRLSTSGLGERSARCKRRIRVSKCKGSFTVIRKLFISIAIETTFSS